MGRYLGSKTEIKEALKNKDWSFLEYAIDFEKIFVSWKVMCITVMIQKKLQIEH